MFRKSITLAAVLLVAAMSLAAGAEQPTRWLNVKVKATENHADVSVRVPVALVNTLLEAVSSDQVKNGRIRIDTGDVTIDWPKVLRTIEESPDGKFVTIDSDEANVEVKKLAGTLHIDIQKKTGDREKVKVLVPAALLDAISIDDQGQLDIKNLLAHLGSSMVGDLVRVEAPDASVRVWID